MMMIMMMWMMMMIMMMMMMMWMLLGADDLAMADSLWTCSRDGAVKLRSADCGAAAERPLTVMSALRETVDRVPDHVALGRWRRALLWTRVLGAMARSRDVCACVSDPHCTSGDVRACCPLSVGSSAHTMYQMCFSPGWRRAAAGEKI